MLIDLIGVRTCLSISIFGILEVGAEPLKIFQYICNTTLEAPALEACRELVEEQHRKDILRSYGLEPRHRVLLSGPPGNGKTSLAEAIAAQLLAPLFVVRYEAVIGSFLGEASGMLKRLFDFVRTHQCVLFFDEFDTLGKERGDGHEPGSLA
jgi:SpoVK/Ycf46/Vps4 family AAA+-type ATPase